MCFGAKMAAENEVLVPLLILVQCSELLITWSKLTPKTLVSNENEKRQIDQTNIGNKYCDYKHESDNLSARTFALTPTPIFRQRIHTPSPIPSARTCAKAYPNPLDHRKKHEQNRPLQNMAFV